MAWGSESNRGRVKNKQNTSGAPPSERGIIEDLFDLLLNRFIEIQFTYRSIHPSKLYNLVVFNIFARLCNHQHNQTWEHFFITTKINLVPISSHSPFSLSSFPRIYFLSLRSCRCWTFIMKRITHYVAFCEWLLSLRIVFSRLIHVVACIRMSLFSIAK